MRLVVGTAVHRGDDAERSAGIAESGPDLVRVVRARRAVVEPTLLGQVVDDALLPDGGDLALEPSDPVHPPEDQGDPLGQDRLQVPGRLKAGERAVEVGLPGVARLDLGQDRAAARGRRA